MKKLDNEKMRLWENVNWNIDETTSKWEIRNLETDKT